MAPKLCWSRKRPVGRAAVQSAHVRWCPLRQNRTLRSRCCPTLARLEIPSPVRAKAGVSEGPPAAVDVPAASQVSVAVPTGAPSRGPAPVSQAQAALAALGETEREWPRPRLPGHHDRQPEGRRRQNHLSGQPGGLSGRCTAHGCSWSTWTRRGTRPPPSGHRAPGRNAIGLQRARRRAATERASSVRCRAIPGLYLRDRHHRPCGCRDRTGAAGEPGKGD